MVTGLLPNAQVRWRRVAALSAGLFAVVTVLVVVGPTVPVDDAVVAFVVGTRTDTLTALARILHHVGSLVGVLAMLAIGSATLAVVGRWRLALVWVAMVALAQLGSTVAKLLVGRARPDGGLVTEISAAYPSGHAMVAGAAVAIGLAAVCSLAWPHWTRRAMVVAVSWTILMAWSRTWLLAHWLSDVVGGALLGTVVVATTMAVVAPTLSRDRGG